LRDVALSIRFLEDPVRHPDRNASSRPCSETASIARTSLTVPLSASQELHHFHLSSCLARGPLPVLSHVRGPLSSLEDCSSVGFDNSPETLKYKALPSIFQCGNGGLIVDMLRVRINV
jgi:hypothetical protein